MLINHSDSLDSYTPNFNEHTFFMYHDAFVDGEETCA